MQHYAYILIMHYIKNQVFVKEMIKGTVAGNVSSHLQIQHLEDWGKEVFRVWGQLGYIVSFRQIQGTV